MESLKANKDIKNLPHYVGKQVHPVLEKKQDQTIKKALKLLEVKYGRSRTEKIEECLDDLLKFQEEGQNYLRYRLGRESRKFY